MSRLDNVNVEASAVYVAAVLVALLLGAALTPVVLGVVADSDDPGPGVAVVTLRGGTTSENVNPVTRDLRQLRSNQSVEAVVLRINSPGGPVSPTEELYLAVNRTTQEMPVVAYVEGVAASGGYYGILPADDIYVKGSSQVGSVGVIVEATLSDVEEVAAESETYVRTGPDKSQVSKDQLRRNLERVQATFVGSVMHHRGDELTLSRAGVSQGRIYLGTQAVQNGFADGIGDLNTAIETAAARAEPIEGDRYNVFYKEQPSSGVRLLVEADGTATSAGTIRSVGTRTRADSTFVRPVRYYAIWGVPAEDGNQTATRVIDDE